MRGWERLAAAHPLIAVLMNDKARLMNSLGGKAHEV
jgi:hypothetical protein